MAWRVVTLLALAALAVPATSAAPSATWPASSSQPGPLLGMVFENTRWRLARIDPGTLEAMTGPSIVVGRSSGSWAFSPDRSLLAVATETLVGRRIVRILDPASLRQRTAVRLTGYLGPIAWPAPDRVLAISDCCAYNPSKIEVVSYDPLARRLVRRATIDGTRLRAVRTRGGFVLLVGPEEGLGATRLVVVDANGGLRSTALEVVAGHTQPEGEPYVFRRRLPGLAVDPEGGRAFVVTPESHVVEIDLATLAVREHDLSQTVSLLGRLHDWLEPAAQAKASEGPVRTARWLGNGLLAVSGSDSHATVSAGRIERQTWTPAGLKLIDTATWSVRTVDDRVSGFVFRDGLLLATGSTIGLVAYGPYGDTRFALFPDRSPWVSAVVDRRAYVGFGGGPDQTLTVVDLATGQVVGERQGILPALLLGPADPWSG
jgi:hypothetical protein